MLRHTFRSLALLAGAILGLFAFTAGASAATLQVTNLNDDGSPGSLREVIAAAAPGDTITFQSGLQGSIALSDSAGEIAIDKSLKISGPGADKIAIDAPARIFDISNANVSISGLLLSSQMKTGPGGAIEASGGSLTLSDDDFYGNNAGGGGGAIYADTLKSLTVSNSLFTSDSSFDGGGALFAVNTGSVSITGSTFASDSASVGDPQQAGLGGALYLQESPAVVSDSTLTANNASNANGGPSGGGAIYTNAPLTLRSDTIDANDVDGGGIGSGLDAGADVTAIGTLIADNIGAANCERPVASSTYSMEGPGGSTSCGLDLQSAEPGLMQLGAYGGYFGYAVLTQALPLESPAADAIPAKACPTTVDERGVKRPGAGEAACSVGAFESGYNPSAIGPLPVSGTPQYGATLTAEPAGVWYSPGTVLTFTYQWKLCTSTGASCQSIAGAKAPTFTLTSADVGHEVTVAVKANDGHASQTVSASPVGPVAPPPPPQPTSPPVITGNPVAGAQLSTTTGSWNSSGTLTYTYQWLECNSGGGECSAIMGATSPQLTLQSTMVGHDIDVQVTATDPWKQSVTGSARVVGPVTG